MPRRRAALALACAAAALAVGDALNSLPAAGVPCSTVAPTNPSSATGAAPTCDPTLTPYDYYGAMRSNTLNLAQLGLDTNGALLASRAEVRACELALLERSVRPRDGLVAGEVLTC